jgi:hypothetical protein
MLLHCTAPLRENPRMERFDAPWGRRLRSATVLLLLVLIGMPYAVYAAQPERGMMVPVIFAVVGCAVTALGVLFVIRGYRLDERGLHVERLVWSNRVPLEGLQRAWVDHEATAKSTRLFGNSGFFCIAGHFMNRKLGRYRMFATDAERAVVLDLGSRKIVVTPADPWAFQDALRRLRPTAEIGTKPAA